MSHVVLEDFTDLKDKRKVYRKGSTFPRPSNKNVSEKRLEELTTERNRIGAPLIKKVEEDVVEEDVIVDEVVEEQPEKKKEKKKKQNKKTDKEQN